MTPRRSLRAAAVMLLLVLVAALFPPAPDALTPTGHSTTAADTLTPTGTAGHSAEFHAEPADGADHAVLGKRLRPQAVLPAAVVLPTSVFPVLPAPRGDHSFRPPTSTGSVLRV